VRNTPLTDIDTRAQSRAIVTRFAANSAPAGRGLTTDGAMPEPELSRMRGQRALLVGLGTRGGGEGVARYLAEAGLEVVILDGSQSPRLHEVVDRLRTIDRLDFSCLKTDQDSFSLEGFSLVVRNPAVPLRSPIIKRAESSGLPVRTEASIFLQAYPGKIVGVTGSKGKTSTAYFIHHLLGGSQGDSVHLVGNMGGSSLEVLSRARPTSTAVFEFSSFQTESIASETPVPEVSVLTNLQDDHQDRYDSLEAYWRAKSPLFDKQMDNDWRVHAKLPIPQRQILRSQQRWCAVGQDDPSAHTAVWVDNSLLKCREQESTRVVGDVSGLAILDFHRRGNALLALAVALLLHVPDKLLIERASNLPNVPHRMERLPAWVGEATWINDTAATTPAAAIAAARSQVGKGSLTVISGGASKGLDLVPLVDALVAGRADVVLLPGAESVRIKEELRRQGHACECLGPVAGMDEAVHRAASLRNDIVLLSPGCASFASHGHAGFEDEFERGGQFVIAVLDRAGHPVSDRQAATLCAPRRPDIDEIIAS